MLHLGIDLQSHYLYVSHESIIAQCATSETTGVGSGYMRGVEGNWKYCAGIAIGGLRSIERT